MKVFDSTETWEDKVNFVDENNVVLGYDMSQSCCEHADWFVSDRPWIDGEPLGENAPDDDAFWGGYTFDTSFREEFGGGESLDAGGMVVFRAEHPDKPDLFIHIFNCHNGYYGHGWSWSGPDVKQEGLL